MKGRRISVRVDVSAPTLQISKLRYWSRKNVVYILRANKPVRSPDNPELKKSRIVYIGESKQGAKRSANSLVAMSNRVFGEQRGVKQIDAHVLTFHGRQGLVARKLLEGYLLKVFEELYGDLPYCNRRGTSLIARKNPHFRRPRLVSILEKLSS